MKLLFVILGRLALESQPFARNLRLGSEPFAFQPKKYSPIGSFQTIAMRFKPPANSWTEKQMANGWQIVLPRVFKTFRRTIDSARIKQQIEHLRRA